MRPLLPSALMIQYNRNSFNAQMLDNYELAKEINLLGIKTLRYLPKPGSSGLPIEVTQIDEGATLKYAGLLSTFMIALFPDYIASACIITAFLPFAGEDENGNPCGWQWLRLKGDNDEVGFGKHKKKTFFRNMFDAPSRKKFAIKFTILFFVGGLILSSIIVDGFGYKGLRGI